MLLDLLKLISYKGKKPMQQIIHEKIQIIHQWKDTYNKVSELCLVLALKDFG